MVLFYNHHFGAHYTCQNNNKKNQSLRFEDRFTKNTNADQGSTDVWFFSSEAIH